MILSLLTCGALLMPVTGFAQSAIDLSVRTPPHLKPVNDWNIDLLQPTVETPITFQQQPIPAVRSAKVRIEYASNYPASVLIATKTDGFWEYNSLGYLWAILPATDGERVSALFNLSVSPLWSGGVQRRVMTVYALSGQHPEIYRVRGEGNPTLYERISAYVSHSFSRENYDSHAMHYLRGYRIGGISFAASLTVVLVICFLYFVFRSKKRLPHIGLSFLVLLLCLYQVRSMIDLVRATVADTSQWSSEQTYGEFGEVYQAVEALLVQESIDHSTTVAVCGQLTTPLKYFLYPARVEPASEVWNSADFAVLLDIWDEQDGVVRCGNNAREGTIEQAISPQTAIAKFPTTPDS